MPFKKNDPNINRRGRPPVRPDLPIAKIKKLAADFLQDKIKDLGELYEKLKPKEKVQLIIQMYKMTMPPPVEELERLSEEDLDRLIEKLSKN